MKTSKSLLCENCGHLVPQIDEFGQENDHCPYCGYILISLEEKEKLMSDLKPCPFCGTSNEKHNNIVKLYDDEYYAYEYCNACGARVYANWNTRPIEDALQARIEELERRIANALDSATAAQNCIKIARVDIYKVLERIKYILTAPQKEG